MAPDPPSASPVPDDGIDLYCLKCGYNLRALPGDPRRCPECGHLNPVGMIHIPAELISRQLRDMETAPAICVAALLFGLPFTLFYAYSCNSYLRNPGPDLCLLMCRTLPELLWIAFFVYGLSRFASSCLNKPGWFGILVRYHAYAFLVLAVLVGVPLLFAYPTWLLFGQKSTYPVGAPLFTGTAIGGVVLAFLLRRFVSWAYERAKEEMEPMQREVAVLLARERLRKELSRQQY